MKQVTLIKQQNTFQKIKDELNSFIKRDKDGNWLECINHWELIIMDLTISDKNHITWSTLHSVNYITKIEALFLLLDLPTGFLRDNPEFVPDYEPNHDPYSQGSICPITGMRRCFTDSFEMTALNRSNLHFSAVDSQEAWSFVVNVNEFIEWSIEAGFTELINSDENKITAEPKSNIESYNNNYRKWSEFHNARVVITAYENNKSSNTNPKSFTDSNKYYNLYKDELVPKSEGGKLPARTTLRDYIYKYDKFIKSMV